MSRTSRKKIEKDFCSDYHVTMADKTERDPWLMKVGKEIRRLREAADLSQQGLATKVGHLSGRPMKRSTVAQYELGTDEPPIRRLRDIADALGVDVSALTGERVAHPLEIAFQSEDLTEAEKKHAYDIALAVIQAERANKHMPRPE